MSSIAALPTPTTSNWDWQGKAVCRGTDPEVFFMGENERGSRKRLHEERAKAMCAQCPVRQACLDWAVEVGEAFGVWGGTTPGERQRLDLRSSA
ncbi:MAG: transcription factor WhiB [Pseudonocardiales bacterium]|nr:transcription factor WhiB [Pseudonocardiales bacterium]